MPERAAQKSVEVADFKKILSRNVSLPLGLGILSAGVFVGIMMYLLNVLSWVEHTERVIANANHLSKLAVDMESGMRGFLLTGDEAFLLPYRIAEPQFEPELAALSALVQDNPAQVESLRRVMSGQRAWARYAAATIDLKRRGGDYLNSIKLGEPKVQMDQIRAEFVLFIATEERLRLLRTESARTSTEVLVVVYLLLNIGVAALLALLGRGELMRLAENYGESMRQQMLHNTELERNAWARTGESELGTRIAAQLQLLPLATTTLDFVTGYVGAAVGALYLVEAGGRLRRIASHGLRHADAADDADAPVHHLQPRESLVGQAAFENRLIQLDAVPAGYLDVSSGLGAAAPRHLVIAPLMSEGRVNAVLEVGFLREVTALDHDFLKQVGENIGASLEAALQRERLEDVLGETQRLNEEMQVQQEELRVTNEELEEQSRALEESQVRLENQQAELEQTNEQLIEQAAMLDLRNAALAVSRRELEERALALESASRYKSEFLANMSHELRTPLNSSLILAKLLSENNKGNLDDEQVSFAETIYAAGNDLLDLINDILDIAKVEAGKLELSLEHVPLQRVLQSLTTTFEPMAGQKKLRFSVDPDAGLPLTLHTDRQRLEQILKNLLSNAIKFTDAGAVTLAVRSAVVGQLDFIVSDSGIGIEAQHQESIFEAFSQADGTTSRRFGGTGLGLSISRDLAALLGGAISMQSTPGVGSQFTLRVPVDHFAGNTQQEDGDAHVAGAVTPAPPSSAMPTARLPMPAPMPAPAPPSVAQTDLPSAPASAPVRPTEPFADDREQPANGERTVLVIEDDPVFARILYNLAHEQQYRCLVALNAEDGLAMAQQHQVDAILLDLGLPDRSGLSVLQVLKETPATRHVAVHIISGTDNGAEALHLGAVGFARKPATRDDLRDVFLKLEARLSQKIKRLLLVEDDAVQRESMVRLIADADVEIVAVDSGEQALARLRDTVFDCMVVDLSLPDMQGGQLLERMASEPICAFPPVIVYTGRSLTRAEETDLMRYSRSIIIKGARSPERLLDEVTLFLHKVEDQLSPDRQTMLKAVRSRDRVFDGRTVLLVDDDVRNVFALTSALEQLGLKVEVGRTGFEAISQVEALPLIDLVLMDIMMPGMDGLEATRRIRQDARFRHLPIIAVTAKATRHDHEQCLLAGANDYLPKPIDLARLNSLLRVWMPKLERN